MCSGTACVSLCLDLWWHRYAFLSRSAIFGSVWAASLFFFSWDLGLPWWLWLVGPLFLNPNRRPRFFGWFMVLGSDGWEYGTWNLLLVIQVGSRTLFQFDLVEWDQIEALLHRRRRPSHDQLWWGAPVVLQEIPFSAFEGVQIFCPRFNASGSWVRVPFCRDSDWLDSSSATIRPAWLQDSNLSSASPPESPPKWLNELHKKLWERIDLLNEIFHYANLSKADFIELQLESKNLSRSSPSYVTTDFSAVRMDFLRSRTMHNANARLAIFDTSSNLVPSVTHDLWTLQISWTRHLPKTTEVTLGLILTDANSEAHVRGHYLIASLLAFPIAGPSSATQDVM